MDLLAYLQQEWWLKWYAVINVTEEGLYADEQVPDDYGGPQLQIQMGLTFVLATRNGYLQDFTVGHLRDVQDKTRKKGMGYNVAAFEDIYPAFSVDPFGPSAEYIDVQVVENDFYSDIRGKLIAIAKAALAKPPL